MRKVFVYKWQKDNIQRIEFNYYWEKYVAFQSEKIKSFTWRCLFWKSY